MRKVGSLRLNLIAHPGCVNQFVNMYLLSGREVLDEAFNAVAVGVTTDEIDRIVHEASVDRECYPSPLNYYQFPKSCCTSVNEVICHGIPDMRPLQVRILCKIVLIPLFVHLYFNEMIYRMVISAMLM